MNVQYIWWFRDHQGAGLYTFIFNYISVFLVLWLSCTIKNWLIHASNANTTTRGHETWYVSLQAETPKRGWWRWATPKKTLAPWDTREGKFYTKDETVAHGKLLGVGDYWYLLPDLFSIISSETLTPAGGLPGESSPLRPPLYSKHNNSSPIKMWGNGIIPTIRIAVLHHKSHNRIAVTPL